MQQLIEEVVPRATILKGRSPKEGFARYILRTEPHHDHPIVRSQEGRLYWKVEPSIRQLIGRERLDLGDLVELMGLLGHGPNSETLRKMYRCMGYSLSGYYDIFYEESSNSDVDGYEPNKMP